MSTKEVATPEGLAKPAGVWSTVVVSQPGKLVCVAGLLATDANRNIVGPGDITVQTRQVCENLKAALASVGAQLSDVIRVDVYIANMDHFDAIHAVRRQYFTKDPPASTMVEVSRFTKPEALIEITALAVIS